MAKELTAEQLAEANAPSAGLTAAQLAEANASADKDHNFWLPDAEERARIKAEVDPLVPKAEEALTSARRSALSGATLGTAPAIIGASETDEEAAQTKKDYQKASKEHPIFNAMGSSLVPVPGMQGASGIKKLAALGGIGAGMGGIQGYNASEDPTLTGKLKDAAVSAGVGAVAMPVASQLGDNLMSAGSGLRKYFGRKAGDAGASAIGYRSGINNAAEQRGLSAADMADMGNAAREKGLIPFGGSKEAVAGKAQELADSSGKQIGAVYDQAKASGVEPDFAKAAQYARKYLSTEPWPVDQHSARVAKGLGLDPKSLRTPTTIAPDQIRASGLANKHIKDLEAAAAMTPNPGWDMLHEMKSRVWDTVSPKPTAPLANEMLRNAAGGSTRSIENQIAKATDLPTLLKLRAANKDYGLSQNVGDFARKAATREQALKSPSVGYGLLGGLVGAGQTHALSGSGTLSGVAGALGFTVPWAKRLAETRGAAAATHALGAVEKMIRSGTELATIFGTSGVRPGVSGGFHPGALGLGVAKEATTPEERVAAHQEAMNKDPEYRKKVEGLAEKLADQQPDAGRPGLKYFNGSPDAGN